jgi:hypothetical protein
VKRTAVALAVIVISMAIFLPFSFVNAQTSGYTIQKVNHDVQILYSGYVVITDTIQISGQMPSTFEFGVPYKYGPNIVQAIAYDSSFSVLSVTVGVQLQQESGFYGASVSLPSGTSNTFTVVFILSNAVLTQTDSKSGNPYYNFDFPAYPAFLQSVSECDVSIIAPTTGTIIGVDKPDGVVNASSYVKLNLPALTYAPATGTFYTITTGYVQKIGIQSLDRSIVIGPSGTVTCKDTYHLTNNSTSTLTFFVVNLPLKSTDVVARDQFGAILSTGTPLIGANVITTNVTLAISVGPGEASILTFDYSMVPVSHDSSGRYVLNLDLFAPYNYFIDSASVTVTPPEGANIVTPDLSQIGSSANLNRNAFQQSLTINRDGVSSVNSLITSEDVVPVSYDYNSLWIAFRPTTWIWAVVIVGVVILALLTRPRARVSALAIPVVKVAPGVTLTPEHIRQFTDAYEERAKINLEMRALEARAQHGRIPRRRYKVQRHALEIRLEALAQNLAQLKAILASAGGSYADIVRQLETADVELNEVQLTTQSLEVRHEAGEISLETYRKQLTDLERRKEKAETTVNGLLLRLRGEAR